MKIALISDIHSNLEALTSCCDMALAQGVERFICLGDMVGYGPEPQTTLEYLQQLPGFTAVLGNHDENIFSSVETVNNPVVQEVAEWSAKQLSKQQIDFLKSLPYQIVENGVTYVHASTHHSHEWPYIIDIDAAEKCMDAASTNLVFYGHTHIPMLFHEHTDNTIELITPEPERVIPLNQNHRYVINVGSVGQPRDNNNRACFVIYDEDKHAICYFRVAYEYEKTMAKISRAGLNEFFAERLATGQ